MRGIHGTAGGEERSLAHEQEHHPLRNSALRVANPDADRVPLRQPDDQLSVDRRRNRRLGGPVSDRGRAHGLRIARRFQDRAPVLAGRRTLALVARAGDRDGAGDGGAARVEHAERDVDQRGELDVAQIASLVEPLGDVDDLEPAPLGVPALEDQPVDARPVEGDGEAAVLADGQVRRSESAVHADELLHLARAGPGRDPSR